MRPREIFSKTTKFVWLKLRANLVGGLAIILSIVIMIGLVTFFPVFTYLWLILGVLLMGIAIIILEIALFMLKASHVAVVTEAVVSGRIPDDMIAYGQKKVNVHGWGSMASFYFLFRLIGGAAKQVSNFLTNALGGVMSSIPGGKLLSGLTKLFMYTFLDSVPETILAWTFYKSEERRIRTALQGLRIYLKNFKTMTKSAFVTALVIICVRLVFFVLVITALFTAIVTMNFWMLIPTILIAIIIKACKNAFLDSYIMVTTVGNFMQVAPTTQVKELDFDLYRKCNKYRRLEARANKE